MEKTVRAFVVGFLHWNGENHGKLTRADEVRVRSLADGFGPGVTPANPDLFWDWSHVRDSSDEAFTAMAAMLERRGYGTAPSCGTCGGSTMVRPHPTALVTVRCPACCLTNAGHDIR